ncbi:MAG: hypothetical protein CBB68_08495 [Rhodospirillaceae bacterium TMED8]|nr:coproporphyrinogen III oxidase [Magnetovibrio sp.]OUT50409.1 MAG: hypothetical protein CBB68_08495 [Rhodospirillaceae bacterium TMED8]
MTNPLAIYFHWPFCQSKCPYCDFNSHVWREIDQRAWRRALISELDFYAMQTQGRTVRSVYFGGGTPSLMPTKTVKALIEAIHNRWGLAACEEITLEANPSSSETLKFKALKEIGINRLSIGVQALNDDALTFLGRAHSSKEALEAIDRAANTFDKFSFDLMYGLPNQSIGSWRSALRRALSIANGHLSLYELTIEPGTEFFKHNIKGVTDKESANMFEMTRAMMADAGMPAYEVSNHAKPGHESRHNLNYWRGGDYLGIGPGAHGRITISNQCIATHQIHNPVRWLKKVSLIGHGTAKHRNLSPYERALELIMTGLRTREGIDMAYLEILTGLTRNRLINPSRLSHCIEAGFLKNSGNILTATEVGIIRLNSVLETLLVADTQYAGGATVETGQ